MDGMGRMGGMGLGKGRMVRWGNNGWLGWGMINSQASKEKASARRKHKISTEHLVANNSGNSMKHLIIEDCAKLLKLNNSKGLLDSKKD